MDAKYILRLAIARSSADSENARRNLAKAEQALMQAKIDFEEAKSSAEKAEKSHQNFIKEVNDFKDWNSV